MPFTIEYIGIPWEDVEDYAKLITTPALKCDTVIKHYFDNLKPNEPYIIKLDNFPEAVALKNWIFIAKPEWMIRTSMPIGYLTTDLRGNILKFDGINLIPLP